MIKIPSRPKKRVFLMLIIVSFCLISLSVYGLWLISYPGLANIHTNLPWIVGGFLFLLISIAGAGVIGIIFAIFGFTTFTIFRKFAWGMINMLFPIAIVLGKIFDLDKEKIERSFIELSNHLIKKRKVEVAPEKLLILVPHCIQKETCIHKVTQNAMNCRRCGECQVGDLCEFVDQYGINLAIVTGGTLARKVVKELRPQAILAIACERDLTSGIQDVFPMPVIGVLNERPFGPCLNTRVDIDKVRETIELFLKK